jgi:hypothetical protein
MRFLQKFFGFVVLVSLSNIGTPAFAFDLSQAFNLHLEGAPAEQDSGLPAGMECKGKGGQALNFMNSTVLGWKTTTPDQYMNRALVKGTIASFFPDRTGHTHFGIFLDSDGTPDLEVIYNDEFGELPKLNVGMTVIACGDYITVGPHAHLPSPLGAIIHWVHFNPGDRDGGKHFHGFLVINNKPYGTLTTARGRIHH